MAHDVFISHSHIDKPIADAVCAMLESKKIRCWIAPRDIAPGVDWPTAISTAISGSRVFVLIFSGNSNRSEDVGRELILAANNNLVIIPFRIDNAAPEPGKLYYLARTHWLDAMNPPTQEQIENLVSAVQLFLTQREKSQDGGFSKTTSREKSPEHEQKIRNFPKKFQFSGRKILIGSVASFLFLALSIFLFWRFNNQNKVLKTPSAEIVYPAIANTVTLNPTVTLAPTSTVEPEPTPNVIPDWVVDYSDPIQRLISDHDSNLSDGFYDKFYTRGLWLDTSKYPNPLVFENEKLLLSNVSKLPWTFWYTDFVMAFSWRFELDDSSSWILYIRGGEGTIEFYKDYVKICATPRDNNEYHFEPTDEMNHTIIIVKDESLAVIINEQPVYYGDFLSTEWKSGETAFGIRESAVFFDDFQFWNLNDLK